MSTALAVLDLGHDVLTWRRQGPFRRVHELHSGEPVIATLTFSGVFRARCLAEFGVNRWQIERRGIGIRTLAVLDEQGEDEVARFQSGWWSGGTFSILGASSYRWRRFGFLGRRYCFVREDGGGDPLLTFRSRLSFFGHRGEIFVDADARRLRELPLLVVVGWYLMLRRPSRAV